MYRYALHIIKSGYVAVILQRYKDTFKKEPVLVK
jgi:hypothetical protein